MPDKGLAESREALNCISNELHKESMRILECEAMGMPRKCISCPDRDVINGLYCEECNLLCPE
jgi:hypothetical protein